MNLLYILAAIVVGNTALLTNTALEPSGQNNPVLMKLLQTVDAATTDERLLDVSLQLLKSLCVCMRETLKAKQSESASFSGDSNSLQAEDDRTPNKKVLSLYQNIYNKTCFDLKNELAVKVNKSAKFSSYEEKEFILKSECGKNSFRATTNKNVITLSHVTAAATPAEVDQDSVKLEDILYETFIKTRNYHRFRTRMYSLYKGSGNQARIPRKHSVIVILTFHPLNGEIPSISNRTKLSEELNNTMYSHSPIEIDIIDTRFGQKENITEDNVSKEASNCTLKSIYNFLLQSEKNNKTKVFKLMRRSNTIKVYIDVPSGPNHTDYSKTCCSNGTEVLLCKIDISNESFESKEITIYPPVNQTDKNVKGNFKDTIAKIKTLVKLYDKKIKKIKIKRSSVKPTETQKNGESELLSQDDTNKRFNKNNSKNASYSQNVEEHYTRTFNSTQHINNESASPFLTGSKELWMNSIVDDDLSKYKGYDDALLNTEYTVPFVMSSLKGKQDPKSKPKTFDDILLAQQFKWPGIVSTEQIAEPVTQSAQNDVDAYNLVTTDNSQRDNTLQMVVPKYDSIKRSTSEDFHLTTTSDTIRKKYLAGLETSELTTSKGTTSFIKIPRFTSWDTKNTIFTICLSLSRITRHAEIENDELIDFKTPSYSPKRSSSINMEKNVLDSSITLYTDDILNVTKANNFSTIGALNKTNNYNNKIVNDLILKLYHTIADNMTETFDDPRSTDLNADIRIMYKPHGESKQTNSFVTLENILLSITEAPIDRDNQNTDHTNLVKINGTLAPQSEHSNLVNNFTRSNQPTNTPLERIISTKGKLSGLKTTENNNSLADFRDVSKTTGTFSQNISTIYNFLNTTESETESERKDNMSTSNVDSNNVNESVLRNNSQKGIIQRISIFNSTGKVPISKINTVTKDLKITMETTTAIPYHYNLKIPREKIEKSYTNEEPFITKLTEFPSFIDFYSTHILNKMPVNVTQEAAMENIKALSHSLGDNPPKMIQTNQNSNFIEVNTEKLNLTKTEINRSQYGKERLSYTTPILEETDGHIDKINYDLHGTKPISVSRIDVLDNNPKTVNASTTNAIGTYLPRLPIDVRSPLASTTTQYFKQESILTKKHPTTTEKDDKYDREGTGLGVSTDGNTEFLVKRLASTPNCMVNYTRGPISAQRDKNPSIKKNPNYSLLLYPKVTNDHSDALVTGKYEARTNYLEFDAVLSNIDDDKLSDRSGTVTVTETPTVSYIKTSLVNFSSIHNQYLTYPVQKNVLQSQSHIVDKMKGKDKIGDVAENTEEYSTTGHYEAVIVTSSSLLEDQKTELNNAKLLGNPETTVTTTNVKLFRSTANAFGVTDNYLKATAIFVQNEENQNKTSTFQTDNPPNFEIENTIRKDTELTIDLSEINTAETPKLVSFAETAGAIETTSMVENNQSDENSTVLTKGSKYNTTSLPAVNKERMFTTDLSNTNITNSEVFTEKPDKKSYFQPANISEINADTISVTSGTPNEMDITILSTRYDNQAVTKSEGKHDTLEALTDTATKNNSNNAESYPDNQNVNSRNIQSVLTEKPKNAEETSTRPELIVQGNHLNVTLEMNTENNSKYVSLNHTKHIIDQIRVKSTVKNSRNADLANGFILSTMPGETETNSNYEYNKLPTEMAPNAFTGNFDVYSSHHNLSDIVYNSTPFFQNQSDNTTIFFKDYNLKLTQMFNDSSSMLKTTEIAKDSIINIPTSSLANTFEVSTELNGLSSEVSKITKPYPPSEGYNKTDDSNIVFTTNNVSKAEFKMKTNNTQNLSQNAKKYTQNKRINKTHGEINPNYYVPVITKDLTHSFSVAKLPQNNKIIPFQNKYEQKSEIFNIATRVDNLNLPPELNEINPSNITQPYHDWSVSTMITKIKEIIKNGKKINVSSHKTSGAVELTLPSTKSTKLQNVFKNKTLYLPYKIEVYGHNHSKVNASDKNTKPVRSNLNDKSTNSLYTTKIFENNYESVKIQAHYLNDTLKNPLVSKTTKNHLKVSKALIDTGIEEIKTNSISESIRGSTNVGPTEALYINDNRNNYLEEMHRTKPFVKGLNKITLGLRDDSLNTPNNIDSGNNITTTVAQTVNGLKNYALTNVLVDDFNVRSKVYRSLDNTSGTTKSYLQKQNEEKDQAFSTITPFSSYRTSETSLIDGPFLVTKIMNKEGKYTTENNNSIHKLIEKVRVADINTNKTGITTYAPKIDFLVPSTVDYINDISKSVTKIHKIVTVNPRMNNSIPNFLSATMAQDTVAYLRNAEENNNTGKPITTTVNEIVEDLLVSKIATINDIVKNDSINNNSKSHSEYLNTNNSYETITDGTTPFRQNAIKYYSINSTFDGLKINNDEMEQKRAPPITNGTVDSTILSEVEGNIETDQASDKSTTTNTRYGLDKSQLILTDNLIENVSKITERSQNLMNETKKFAISAKMGKTNFPYLQSDEIMSTKLLQIISPNTEFYSQSLNRNENETENKELTVATENVTQTSDILATAISKTGNASVESKILDNINNTIANYLMLNGFLLKMNNVSMKMTNAVQTDNTLLKATSKTEDYTTNISNPGLDAYINKIVLNETNNNESTLAGEALDAYSITTSLIPTSNISVTLNTLQNNNRNKITNHDTFSPSMEIESPVNKAKTSPRKEHEYNTFNPGVRVIIADNIADTIYRTTKLQSSNIFLTSPMPRQELKLKDKYINSFTDSLRGNMSQRTTPYLLNQKINTKPVTTDNSTSIKTTQIPPYSTDSNENYTENIKVKIKHSDLKNIVNNDTPQDNDSEIPTTPSKIIETIKNDSEMNTLPTINKVTVKYSIREHLPKKDKFYNGNMWTTGINLLKTDLVTQTVFSKNIENETKISPLSTAYTDSPKITEEGALSKNISIQTAGSKHNIIKNKKDKIKTTTITQKSTDTITTKMVYKVTKKANNDSKLKTLSKIRNGTFPYSIKDDLQDLLPETKSYSRDEVTNGKTIATTVAWSNNDSVESNLSNPNAVLMNKILRLSKSTTIKSDSINMSQNNRLHGNILQNKTLHPETSTRHFKNNTYGQVVRDKLSVPISNNDKGEMIGVLQKNSKNKKNIQTYTKTNKSLSMNEETIKYSIKEDIPESVSQNTKPYSQKHSSNSTPKTIISTNEVNKAEEASNALSEVTKPIMTSDMSFTQSIEPYLQNHKSFTLNTKTYLVTGERLSTIADFSDSVFLNTIPYSQKHSSNKQTLISTIHAKEAKEASNKLSEVTEKIINPDISIISHSTEPIGDRLSTINDFSESVSQNTRLHLQRHSNNPTTKTIISTTEANKGKEDSDMLSEVTEPIMNPDISILTQSTEPYLQNHKSFTQNTKSYLVTSDRFSTINDFSENVSQNTRLYLQRHSNNPTTKTIISTTEANKGKEDSDMLSEVTEPIMNPDISILTQSTEPHLQNHQSFTLNTKTYLTTADRLSTVDDFSVSAYEANAAKEVSNVLGKVMEPKINSDNESFSQSMKLDIQNHKSFTLNTKTYLVTGGQLSTIGDFTENVSPITRIYSQSLNNELYTKTTTRTTEANNDEEASRILSEVIKPIIHSDSKRVTGDTLNLLQIDKDKAGMTHIVTNKNLDVSMTKENLSKSIPDQSSINEHKNDTETKKVYDTIPTQFLDKITNVIGPFLEANTKNININETEIKSKTQHEIQKSTISLGNNTKYGYAMVLSQNQSTHNSGYKPNLPVLIEYTTKPHPHSAIRLDIDAEYESEIAYPDHNVTLSTNITEHNNDTKLSYLTENIIAESEKMYPMSTNIEQTNTSVTNDSNDTITNIPLDQNQFESKLTKSAVTDYLTQFMSDLLKQTSRLNTTEIELDLLMERERELHDAVNISFITESTNDHHRTAETVMKIIPNNITTYLGREQTALDNLFNHTIPEFHTAIENAHQSSDGNTDSVDKVLQRFISTPVILNTEKNGMESNKLNLMLQNDNNPNDGTTHELNHILAPLKLFNSRHHPIHKKMFILEPTESLSKINDTFKTKPLGKSINEIFNLPNIEKKFDSMPDSVQSLGGNLDNIVLSYTKANVSTPNVFENSTVFPNGLLYLSAVKTDTLNGSDDKWYTLTEKIKENSGMMTLFDESDVNISTVNDTFKITPPIDESKSKTNSSLSYATNSLSTWPQSGSMLTVTSKISNTQTNTLHFTNLNSTANTNPTLFISEIPKLSADNLVNISDAEISPTSANGTVQETIIYKNTTTSVKNSSGDRNKDKITFSLANHIQHDISKSHKINEVQNGPTTLNTHKTASELIEKTENPVDVIGTKFSHKYKKSGTTQQQMGLVSTYNSQLGIKNDKIPKIPSQNVTVRTAKLENNINHYTIKEVALKTRDYETRKFKGDHFFEKTIFVIDDTTKHSTISQNSRKSRITKVYTRLPEFFNYRSTATRITNITSGFNPTSKDTIGTSHLIDRLKKSGISRKVGELPIYITLKNKQLRNNARRMNIIPVNSSPKAIPKTTKSIVYNTYKALSEEELSLPPDVTDYWLDDMYMKVRLPLPINSNPGMVFPRRRFNKLDELADLAALFIDDLLDYKEMLDRGELPLERATSREKGQPLCMEQFYRLLGVCRIPQLGKDRLELPPLRPEGEQEELVVVACRNYFYPIPVKAADRGRLTPGEIQAQLLMAMVDAAGAPAAPRVGLLSALQRDAWARARDSLCADETNRHNMELISRALCLVCLDEAGGDRADADADTNALLRTMHGAGSRHHSANRWFDKTVQLIISSDGTVGMCYEHSAAEGVAVVRLAERALARAAVAARPDPPPALLPAPQAMRWALTPDVERAIEQAAKEIDRNIGDLDLKVFTYRGYGREFMKSCRTSPDVYIQLAMQYAYYKMYGHLVSTYESASLRRFLQGRVDNIRSAHLPALAWARAMCADETPPLSDTDDSQKKEQKKLELFEEAAKKQTEIMEANIQGRGIDNHLLGLRETARAQGPLPELFNDPTYKIMNEFKLSTSQVATTTDGTFMGYGAVVPDGYGVSYNPKKDCVIFCIGSFVSSSVTNTEAYRQSLQEALDSMKLMFQHRRAE